MERERHDQDDQLHSDLLPVGWQLLSQYVGPDGAFVWVARVDVSPVRNWVTAAGSTYEEALKAARRRAQLYDGLDRSREA